MKTIVVAGLFASMVAGTATAELLWYTSFEDTNDLGGKYYDLGDAAVDHWLTNNEGQAAVNGNGFSAWYGSTGGVGLTDGDYVGVTNYASGVGGSYYDGDQGYQLSDLDGIFELHFDGYEGNASSISIAIYIADTGYEAADNFSIHWGSDPDSGTLFELDGNGGDGNGSDLEDASGTWMFLEFDISELGSGHLHVRGESNSSTEAYYIDAVSIFGAVIPTPGALALLGLAGIASRRRRR